MKRTLKKTLVLTKSDIRVLTLGELKLVPGASGCAGGHCGGATPACPVTK